MRAPLLFVSCLTLTLSFSCTSTDEKASAAKRSREAGDKEQQQTAQKDSTESKGFFNELFDSQRVQTSVPVAAPAVDLSRLDRYQNDRFGFCIQYPAGYLLPQGESANGHGQEFTSRNGGVQMLTWGRPRIEGESVEAAFRASFRRYNQRGLVYQKELFQDSYVISGALGADTGYYEKQVLLKGAWVGLLFKYVSPNGRTVSPVIAAVSTSFPTCGKQTEPPKPLAVDEVDKIPAGATGTDLARRYCNCQAKANAYAKQLLDQIRSDSAVLTYANSRAALDRHFEWVELVGERYGQCKRIRQKADMSFSDEVKREFKASPDFRRTLAMLADSASVSQEWTNTSEVWCARLAQTKANALRNRPR